MDIQELADKVEAKVGGDADPSAWDVFTIITKDGLSFVVEARDYSMAAAMAVRVLNNKPGRGRGKGLHAMRTTGDHGKSGWFQGYDHSAGAGSNSIGPSFHVM